MKRTWYYLKGYYKETILGPIFKLIEAFFDLLTPLVMARMIDNAVQTGDKSAVIKDGMLLLLLAVLGFGFALICQYSAAKAAYGYGTAVRSDLMKKIQTLSVSELQKFGTSTLMTRMSTDIMAMQTGINMAIRLAIRVPFLIIGSCILAYRVNAQLAFVFLGITPIVVILLYVIMRKNVPMYRKVQKLSDILVRHTRESFTGAKMIRAFVKEEQENKKFREKVDDFEQAQKNANLCSALLNPLSMLTTNLAIVALLFFGVGEIRNELLTQGELIAMIGYMTQIAIALMLVANLTMIFTKAIASGNRVNEVLDYVGETVSTENDKVVEKTETLISADALSFSYGGTHMTLDHLDFQIQKGESVGIIGGIGSGKSTLAFLLCGLYSESEGCISYKGTPLNQLEHQILKDKIHLVMQSPFFFSGTVRHNLLLQSPNATEEDMKRALKIAQCDFILQSEQGLDMQLLEGGKNLSGGQRQRLSIARSLVSFPEILILDDSFSALDAKTERKLREELSKLSVTLILITQKICNIEHFDTIMVLEKSKLAGKGSSEWLLQNCDSYREIYESQNTGKEEKK